MLFRSWHAARKLRRAVDALSRVLAIEFMTAARAIDLRQPLLPGSGTAAALACLREKVSGPGSDRWLTPEIEAAVSLVQSGSVVAVVEQVIGVME